MRADVALVELGLCTSRAQAQQLIGTGQVLMWTSNQAKASEVRKPSQTIEPFMKLGLKPGALPKFVSRGGMKLEGALRAINLSVRGFRCLDVGQSTGGFTDCLLHAGAASVVGIDVGHGQLHAKLKDDPRVQAWEGLNIYKMDTADWLPKVDKEKRPFDLVVADLSFISLRKALPGICALAPGGCQMVLLVKPQFELGPQAIGKNGLVKDLPGHLASLEKEMKSAALENGLEEIRFFACELTGGDGNQEYFLTGQIKQTNPLFRECND